MQVKFFRVPIIDGEAEAARLNVALRTERVVGVERHFVPDPTGMSPGCWVFCLNVVVGDEVGNRAERPVRDGNSGGGHRPAVGPASLQPRLESSEGDNNRGMPNEGEVVTTASPAERPLKDGTTRRKGVDYREVLEPRVFARFAALRDVRRNHANALNIPVFAIFTNEQLAEMARLGTTTVAALCRIDGIGEGRVKNYGPLFAEAMAKILSAEPAEVRNP